MTKVDIIINGNTKDPWTIEDYELQWLLRLLPKHNITLDQFVTGVIEDIIKSKEDEKNTNTRR